MQQQMQVTVPDGVMPGQAFLVDTPTGQMQVTCPPQAGPGMPMLVNIPMQQPVVVQAAPMPMQMQMEQPIMMGIAVPESGAMYAQPAMTTAPINTSVKIDRQHPSGIEVLKASVPAELQPSGISVCARLPPNGSPEPARRGPLPCCCLIPSYRLLLSVARALPCSQANEWADVVEILHAHLKSQFFYNAPCLEGCYFCCPGGPIQTCLCLVNPITCIVCFGPQAHSRTESAKKINELLSKYGITCEIKDNGMEASELVVFTNGPK